jgi:hypothetical protein
MHHSPQVDQPQILFTVSTTNLWAMSKSLSTPAWTVMHITVAMLEALSFGKYCDWWMLSGARPLEI